MQRVGGESGPVSGLRWPERLSRLSLRGLETGALDPRRTKLLPRALVWCVRPGDLETRTRAPLTSWPQALDTHWTGATRTERTMIKHDGSRG